MLEKKADRALKAVSHGAIVRRQRCHQIEWFWEVVHYNLLSVAQ
jgi:hypothetical protein